MEHLDNSDLLSVRNTTVGLCVIGKAGDVLSDKAWLTPTARCYINKESLLCEGAYGTCLVNWFSVNRTYIYHCTDS